MATNKELLQEFEIQARSASGIEPLMQLVARRLHEEKARYNWVGFYLMEDSTPKVLRLGPYVGSFVPIERITLDKGLCGAAATHKKTVVVNNVPADPRYIGSGMVKSNLVTPILVKGEVVAELDVESYFVETFPPGDQEFVEACAAVVARSMEQVAAEKKAKR
jgi:putative methionine-R-sulfoxide reductase with GAF domain